MFYSCLNNYLRLLYTGVQPYQMMLLSFSSKKTDVICGAGTTNSSGTPEFLVGNVLLKLYVSVYCIVDYC